MYELETDFGRDCSLRLSLALKALSELGKVAISTLYHRDARQRLREALAQSQQYLYPDKEKAIVKFLLLILSLGHPVRIKFLRSLAFSIASKQSTNVPTKPPGKNWPQAFEKRHPKLRARRVKTIDWKRHDNHIYDKIKEWFEVIGKVLQNSDLAILPSLLLPKFLQIHLQSTITHE